ncbi:DUF6691 family protein [Paracoccus sanguinis]|uniref:DUF6691 family protein n=1 Tax=Paracoccus sanguinis TaxID=1545044 RepID=UPI0014517079|nr:DUF6691 family protein [Paracoccus sanguinis]QJD15544.1 YeeE/YedE family protein [Paracoccus sanguinis]
MSALRLILPLLCGALFGAGLLVAGMTDPAKVRGFLDPFGAWDPTLAFVMGGAVAAMAVAWRVAGRMTRAATGAPLPGPAPRQLDAPLFVGSALFGLGWGLAGYCPGPAAASALIAPWPFLAFLAAMLAGMAAARLVR